MHPAIELALVAARTHPAEVRIVEVRVYIAHRDCGVTIIGPIFTLWSELPRLVSHPMLMNASLGFGDEKIST